MFGTKKLSKAQLNRRREVYVGMSLMIKLMIVAPTHRIYRFRTDRDFGSWVVFLPLSRHGPPAEEEEKDDEEESHRKNQQQQKEAEKKKKRKKKRKERNRRIGEDDSVDKDVPKDVSV